MRPESARAPRSPADLSIVVERTAPGLDGDGIASRWPGSRLDYIANARWADELTRMLQSALVEGFQESGRLRSVQGDVGRFRTTHTLVIEVRRFEADYAAGALPSRRSRWPRRSAATRTGRCSSRSPRRRAKRVGKPPDTVVAALDAAFAQAASEVAAEVVRHDLRRPRRGRAGAQRGPLTRRPD